MIINQDFITAETLKNRFIGKQENVRSLVSVFEDNSQKMESLAENKKRPYY